MCICGNFQTKKDGESYYTANVDITSIRFVLSEAAQRNYGASSLDIDTTFLNAYLSQATEELIYVKPPALLILFQLVAAHVYWIVRRAIYGSRQSPKQWGLHRDTELKNMRFRIGKKNVEGNTFFN